MKPKKPIIPHHILEVGDILQGSWGYDQTNNNWFEVTAIKGKFTVIVRPIEGVLIKGEEGSMCGRAVPAPGKYIGGEQTHRVKDNCIQFNPGERYRTDGVYERHYQASLWDGVAVHESWYG